MKRSMLLTAVLLSGVQAQAPSPQARQVSGLAEADRLRIEKPDAFSHLIASGEFGSAFLATPDKPIGAHYHAAHDETVVILKGEGKMRLGNREIRVKPNDIVFVPRGVAHDFRPDGTGAVAVSCFSPVFDGKDRVPVDPPNRGE